MNPALHAAIHSATKAQKDLLSQLKDAAAFSRESAMPRTQFGSEQKIMIDYHLKRGILKATADGAIYLDRRAYEDYQAGMKTAGKWVLAAVGIASLIGFLLLLANKT